MGFYCPDCGKDVDVSPEQARFREKLERERDELLTQLAAERALADRLGEAARIMWSYIEEDLSHGCLSPDYRHAIETYGAAFTAWKEARSE